LHQRIKKAVSFGLIWKALFAVSISTLLASGSIFLLGKYTYNKNHEQQIDIRHRQYQLAFSSVLARLKQKETELSWLLPSLIEAEVPVEQALPKITKLISKNWSKIDLESNINSIFIFNSAGEIKGAWGEKNHHQLLTSDWLNQVLKTEQPSNKILCNDDCFQFHLLPFLYNGSLSGVFVFVSSISEIVLHMKEITQADIGILIDQTQSKQSALMLPLWSSKITALTESSKNYSLLLAMQNSYPETIPNKSISYFFDDNTYDVFSIPFGDKPFQATLVIIDNITAELLEKNKGVELYLISGLSSILLSGIILFVLFLKPTAKLKKIIHLLPLIAEKKYSIVKQSLATLHGNRLLTDEIDILDDAAHHLIYTLTKLDSEVEQRNQHLLSRSKELQNERNFISNILDTAQVIIMRLDRLGVIISINQFGEKLIGYDEASLVKKHLFIDLIYDNESFYAIEQVIANLLDNKYRTYQHNSSLYSVDGIKLYVSWFFTLIHNLDTNPEILVVGLDLTQRRAIETELAWLADHDPLTRLFNRRRFEKELHKAQLEARRFNHTNALIFLDIDQFKFINDSSGHQAGDQLLIMVANTLLKAVRNTDIIARFGGDEFVVLAPQINQNGAKSLINKIFRQMMNVEIFFDEMLHKVSISAGLLMFPVDDHNEQDLMASADIAMYKAKDSGRGKWCLVSPDDLNRENVKQRVNWKSKIEKALVEDRFVLYFQPIMRIADKNISHYECLLRMIDEDGSIIAPGFFIGVAEQTGLIRLIDKLVLEMSIQHQKRFTTENLDIMLSINLSGDFLSDPDAFSICTNLLNKYKVKAQQFIFEVTETHAVTNLQSANSFISELTAIGGKFSLDDFGVGFSSMNYLKKLPVQYLKIDGEFIKNLTHDYEDKLFVKAINEIAKGMKIKTIAEFVENSEILSELSEIGVDYAQGYGIGKPMPYLEFHQQKASGSQQKM